MLHNNHDFSEGLEKLPIYFENMQNISTIKRFKYVKTNIPGPNFDIELFEEEYEGCDCHNCEQIDIRDPDESCDLNNSCDHNYVQDPISVDDQNHDCDQFVFPDHNRPRISNQNDVHVIKPCSCITTTGPNYKDTRLLPVIFEHVESKPILECNTNCSCSKSCPNRLVQNGIQIKLEVFDAGIKGLGLRTLEFIPQGTFVCEYAGEVLTKSEAAKRCQNLSDCDMNYLIVLQEHCSSGLLQTFVDPKFKGNIGRLLNHSCQPNLTMFPVRINISVPRLALFANQDIKASEELTFNYGVSHRHGARVSANRKRCYCGSKDCQELLPFDADLCS